VLKVGVRVRHESAEDAELLNCVRIMSVVITAQNDSGATLSDLKLQCIAVATYSILDDIGSEANDGE